MTLSQTGEGATPIAPSAPNWRRSLERVSPLLLVAALIVLWQLLVRWFNVPPFLLPAPTDIVRLMIGREVTHHFPPKPQREPRPAHLSIENLRWENRLKGVSTGWKSN